MIREFKEQNSYDVWMNNNYHPELNLFIVHLHGKWIIIRCQAPGSMINCYLLYALGCFYMLHCFPLRRLVGSVSHILEKYTFRESVFSKIHILEKCTLEKVHLKNWTPVSSRISERSTLFNIFYLMYNFREKFGEKKVDNQANFLMHLVLYFFLLTFWKNVYTIPLICMSKTQVAF